jgi:hypothetical protein
MFDIEIYKICEDTPLRSAHGSGKPVTGIKKLAQRFLVVFLQEAGSAKYRFGRRTDYGTGFMAVLKRGGFRSEMDVKAHFNLAVPSIKQALLNEEHHDDPPGEKFGRVELQSISLHGHYFGLHLVLHSHTESIRLHIPIESR